MRIVLLTSDDRVRGLTSDDGFEIDVISVATIFLLIFTSNPGSHRRTSLRIHQNVA